MDETVFITNKEKAGKAKEFELESELKNGKSRTLTSSTTMLRLRSVRATQRS